MISGFMHRTEISMFLKSSVPKRSSVLEPKFPVGKAPGSFPPFRLSGKGPSDVTKGTSTPPRRISFLISSR